MLLAADSGLRQAVDTDVEQSEHIENILWGSNMASVRGDGEQTNIRETKFKLEKVVTQEKWIEIEIHCTGKAVEATGYSVWTVVTEGERSSFIS